MKSKLKNYKVDPFADSPVVCASTGHEIDPSIRQGLLQVSEISDEKYVTFVKERLVEGDKSLFVPISKSSIKIGNEKKNVSRNVSNKHLVTFQQKQPIYMRHFLTRSHYCH